MRYSRNSAAEKGELYVDGCVWQVLGVLLVDAYGK